MRVAAAESEAPANGGALCPHFHEAIELIGKRWTGAIMCVLMVGPKRFSEISLAVPELSDRLLSERLKELEANGIVERGQQPGCGACGYYALTPKGAELRPALREMEEWARRWLGPPHGLA